MPGHKYHNVFHVVVVRTLESSFRFCQVLMTHNRVFLLCAGVFGYWGASIYVVASMGTSFGFDGAECCCRTFAPPASSLVTGASSDHE